MQMENQSALLISIMAPNSSCLWMKVNCVILMIYLLLEIIIDSS